jgi:hypothetical protein
MSATLRQLTRREDLRGQNLKLAVYLLGVAAFLAAVAFITIWVKH